MSNLIKSSSYISLDDTKLIEVLQKSHMVRKAENPAAEQQIVRNPAEDEEYLAMREQLMRDAETMAQEQVRLAMEEAASVKEHTQHEIEQWWNERRSLDEQQVQKAKALGFEQGYQEGLHDAEITVRKQHSEMLQEAQTVLEQAYSQKEQIIRDSEPFLIELSCAIAKQIIGRQLTVSQDWIIDMVKKVLSRRREQGVITLCVSPQQYAYILDAKEELTLSIDSQAELQIVPDATVHDQGCVLRTPFGSIDARVDTQLTEIKNALYQLALRSEDAHHDV